MIIAQDLASTTYNQMTINAINIGLVDVIARSENMPILLTKFSAPLFAIVKLNRLINRCLIASTSILSLLHRRTGYDFSGYQKNMLLRPIQRHICVSYRNNKRLLSAYEQSPSK